ncbi:MAG: hypothetical protein IPL27_09930 [Lewinellaceae bacterium]|nr:hypothetical protein [Lewinellaceae bacterium]
MIPVNRQTDPFVSDINTNRPIKDLQISIKSTRNAAQVFEVVAVEPGIYRLKTVFADTLTTDLNVTIRGGLGLI